jgi:hypothetical protein
MFLQKSFYQKQHDFTCPRKHIERVNIKTKTPLVGHPASRALQFLPGAFRH